jgi:hypothetical protein
MSAVVTLTGEHLAVSFPGAESILTLKRTLVLPWDEVVSARVDTQRTLKRALGWRVGGGYWPGWFATGHFTYRGRTGERQLWCAYRATEVLVIETARARPRRVVLQVDDPRALAAAISARVVSPDA